MNNKKINYYNLDDILNTKSSYNVIFGERSNGKTYAVLLYGITQYFNGNGQMAIIRRWQEDIRGQRASQIFAALVANNEILKISKGRYLGVHYWAGKFYFCNYDDDGKAIYNDNDCFCYAFALTDMEHNKSISYPHITTIMFDEFIARGTYLVDEFVLFMNTLSSIIRERTNVKIFMLGNTVNKYNPYFVEMGLNHALKMEQGTIDIYRYGENGELKVAVEYCSSLHKQKKNNFYFAFDNPRLHMITTGSWELDLYPHLPVKYTPKNILFIFFIEFSNKIYQCEVIEKEDNIFCYIHDKTTPIKYDDDLVYTLEYSSKMNYNRNIYRPRTELEKKIMNFFIHDKVFYQDNNVGDSINNYLNQCKQM